jgi:hypothetical protein
MGDTLVFSAAGFVAATMAPLSTAILARHLSSYREVGNWDALLPALGCGMVLSYVTLDAQKLQTALVRALVGGPIAGWVAAFGTTLIFINRGAQGFDLSGSSFAGVPFGIGYGGRARSRLVAPALRSEPPRWLSGCCV